MKDHNPDKRILLVEDEAVISLAVSGILKNSGYDTACVYNGESAVQYALESSGINLILMDIDLGAGIDGIEAARRILEIKTIPVVFFTSHCDPEIVEKISGITRYGYVLKNSGQYVLLSSIEMALELFETCEQLKAALELRRAAEDSIPIPLFFKDPDGRYIDVNEAFTDFYGKKKDDLKGKTVFDIAPPEFAQIYHQKDQELFSNHGLQVYETSVKDANGRLHDVIFRKTEFSDSSGNAGGLVGVVLDITDTKKTEKIINARLRLVEFSFNHSLDDVLQKTLDEVCDISGSSIGFYHFVCEDEKMLTLKAWSTRTLNDFCTAAGKGSHYSINEAGVWADAVRQRKPVIHNDYASLPGRKGLPDGHAAVIRELVVPIFRDDKIVAILGVGNKEQEYTDNDVQIVSFFADVAWEIAQRKRSAEAFAESEKNYRLLLDTANEAIIIAQDGMMKFMNRKTVDLFGGYSEEEIRSRPFIEFVFEEDRERVAGNYIRRINGEPAETRYPFRVVISGGEVKWVEVNSVLIEWEGRPATINFYADITGRIHAEEKLKKTELFAQATLDALSTNIAILDENGFIVSVNRAWREFSVNNSFQSEGMCEGSNYLAVCESSYGINSDEAESAADGIREVISGRADEFTLEYPCHSPEEKRWFNMRVTRYAYEGSVRVVVAHENITTRKMAEAELRTLSYVVEQSPVSIVVTDTDGKIEYVNSAAEKTTGYKSEELIGNNPRLLKSGYTKSDEYKKLWDTITSGSYWKGEFHNIRKDKSYYWESATISPIFDEDGKIERFAAVKEDITDRKAAEAEIRKLLREKELILQEVHHRIKNNMNTIKGLLFLQGNEVKDASAAAALHDAESRVQSMVLLYDKLYCSQDFREISLSSYLGPLVDEIIKNFPNREIVKVIKKINDFSLAAKIIFPLGIIINELITNIMKYAFSGKDSGEIEITAEKNDEQVIIKLKDNGKGIPESVNFESSAGFGLNLVAMLTIQIGGSIRIERGSGTEIIIEFTAE